MLRPSSFSAIRFTAAFSVSLTPSLPSVVVCVTIIRLDTNTVKWFCCFRDFFLDCFCVRMYNEQKRRVKP
nr:MAG TPA: hypothetical protein [Caudoviricetes sp.]